MKEGVVETAGFTYSNTEDKLTLIIGNEARIITLDWKKNDITIFITENYSSNGDSITYTETFNLKKKKFFSNFVFPINE